MKNKICILAGPTAVGKTDISIMLAKKLYGEIVSADSAQIYKYMNIGTAKIQEQEMQGINHYMIDEIYPDQSFSVAEYRNFANNYINNISIRGKLPIITGGTGLYINSLINNLDFTEAICDEEFRIEMTNLAKEKGNEYIHQMLKNIDPISYEKLHPNDIRRIIRALEVYKITNKPISKYQEESKNMPQKYEFAYIALNMDREKLYNRINLRVDRMFEKGLIDEVRNLLKMGYAKDLVSMQAIGYRQIVNYLEGECSFDEAIELIKRDSRHYAKRQLTWFRNDKRVFWVNTDSFKCIEDIVENIIRYVAGKITII